MRTLLIATMILAAGYAHAQRMECVEVPKSQKIVFVPWFIPTDQITWEWQGALEPETNSVEPDPCDGLVISPSICEPQDD